MLAALAHPAFRRLFLAQAVALTGTGLATVALGLLAWDLAGAAAGAVLGTALAIKMIAYVTLAPVAAALAERLPRRAFLVGLDLIRAAVVACLPFVTEVWQIYLLILVLQAASAGFTPAFQALVPDVVTDPRDYAGALALLRLTEDLEQIASPVMAAAILSVASFALLFAGTVAGFALSAVMIGGAVLPPRSPAPPDQRFAEAVTKGLRICLRTPRLRGILMLEAAVAAAGAMVLVNTVVLVRDGLALGDAQVALALAAFGAGSILAATRMPSLLDRWTERPVMIGGAAAMVLAVAAVPLAWGYGALLLLWAVAGFGFACTQTPVGLILTRSARDSDRGAVFAAHFALSHGCWLVAYPLAGWLGAAAGMAAVAGVLAAAGAAGLWAVLRLWPAQDGAVLTHDHPDLPPGHPHLADHAAAGGRHAHAFVIDDLHRRWPALR